MSSFPSNKIMFITVFCITIGFGAKFILKSNSQFFQLNFDWDKGKIIKSYGEMILDSVSYNYVKFQKEGFYPKNSETYKISNESGSFYFRYIYTLKNKFTYEFKGVEWITDIPNQVNVNYAIEEVYLPLKTVNGPTIITIGDQLLMENEAKYYRKDIMKMYPANFKGSNFDVFDFQHEALNGNTSSNILNQIKTIEQTDFYILMYGSNESLDSLPAFKTNTKEIFSTLKNKSPKKVIVISLPPSKDELINEENVKKNDVFFEFSKTNDIKLIDTFLLFDGNLEKYLREDGISISRDGYYKLAKETVKFFK